MIYSIKFLTCMNGSVTPCQCQTDINIFCQLSINLSLSATISSAWQCYTVTDTSHKVPHHGEKDRQSDSISSSSHCYIIGQQDAVLSDSGQGQAQRVSWESKTLGTSQRYVNIDTIDFASFGKVVDLILRFVIKFWTTVCLCLH